MIYETWTLIFLDANSKEHPVKVKDQTERDQKVLEMNEKGLRLWQERKITTYSDK